MSDHDELAALIEKSSLGEPGARSLRARTPLPLAEAIVDRAEREPRIFQDRSTYKQTTSLGPSKREMLFTESQDPRRPRPSEHVTARFTQPEVRMPLPKGDVAAQAAQVAVLENRAARTKLFELYYAVVVRFFQNKVSEESREDLIQTTFLVCLREGGDLREPSRFRSYLLSCAHSVLTTHLRQQSHRNARLYSKIDVDQIHTVSFGLSPVAAVMQREEQQLLLDALQRLPMVHQSVLKLYYWEGLASSEIGEVLGLPLATVKTRLRDARSQLADQLRMLASSAEALRSSLDDLDRWARRVRAKAVPTLEADRQRAAPGSQRSSIRVDAISRAPRR